MKLEVGKYIIVKHTHWSISNAEMITIVSVDTDGGLFGDEDEVQYFYTGIDKDGKTRCRSLYEFMDMELIPSSSLLEELL